MNFKFEIKKIKDSFYSEIDKGIIVKIKEFYLKKKSKEIDLNSNRLIKLLHKNYDKLSQRIFQMVKNEFSINIEDSYKKEISSVLENSFKENNHINTMVIGPAGVGKSTLINSVLKIKGTKFEAKTGVGKSITKETKIYTSEKVPILRIYDTPGFDFKNDINTIFKTVKSIVEENLSLNDPDKFINCIWYCICGKRFNDEEKIFIKEIMKLYSGSYLPIIILILQSYDKEESNMMKNTILDILNEEDSENIKNVNFCIMLAEEKVLNIMGEKILVSSYGIPELLNLTEKLIKSSVESALFQNIKNSIKNSSFNFANDLFLSMNKIFDVEINYLKNQKKYLEKIEEENNSDEFSYDSDNNKEKSEEKNNGGKEEEEKINKKDYYNNFSELLSEKLFNICKLLNNEYNEQSKENNLLKNNIKEDLKKIKKIIFEWKNFKSLYEQIISQEFQSLSNKILEKQNEIDFKNKSNLSQSATNWKKECYNEFFGKY